jgi:nitrogen fixation protein NifU and related proteins
MSDTFQSQNQRVMDHFLNPRNVGDLAEPDGVGEVGAVACGDVMRISIQVREGQVVDARFRTFGCGTAIAASSIATELIKGRTVEEARQLSMEEVSAALGGLPPDKSHCPVLAEEAVKAAVEDYLRRSKV